MRAEQRKVEEFLKEHGLSVDPYIRFLDLSSEVGEFSKELLKASGYGDKEPKATEDMKEELGDCLFSLLSLCDCLGLDAEEALDMALTKYFKRFAEKGEIGSGN